MSLTKASFSLINGAPVNVLDYGADPTGTTDSKAAIQAAIDAGSVIYIPSGTYLISGAINIGSSTTGNKRIVGAGMRSTTLKATNAAATLQNKTQHYFIEMQDFTFDGNALATVGISLGIPSGGTGSAAYDQLNNITVYNCTTIALELNSIQYMQINQCFFYGTSNGHGIKAQKLLTSYINNTVVIDNRYGMYLGNHGGASSGSNLVYLNNIQFFGPAPASSTPPDFYLAIDGAYGIYLNGCIFENERVFNNPLVIIANSVGALVTGNIYFQNCSWQGLAFAQDLIQTQGGTRIYFNECRAIRPTAGNYILNQASGGSVFVNSCLAGNGYTDFTTLNWTDGGYVTGSIFETQDPTNLLSVTDGVTAPSTVTGRAFVYVDSADGSLKVKFGNGIVKTLATNP